METARSYGASLANAQPRGVIGYDNSADAPMPATLTSRAQNVMHHAGELLVMAERIESKVRQSIGGAQEQMEKVPDPDHIQWSLEGTQHCLNALGECLARIDAAL